MYLSEASAVSSYLTFLNRTHGILASTEVPLLGRSIDVAYSQNSFIYTYEFKLRDWKRALAQAADHQLGADYAFVCVPTRIVTPAILESASELGVGVVAFERTNAKEDTRFQIALPPRRSVSQWSKARALLVRNIKLIGHVCFSEKDFNEKRKLA